MMFCFFQSNRYFALILLPNNIAKVQRHYYTMTPIGDICLKLKHFI